MFKVINKSSFYLKIFFLLIAFSFVLYISFIKADTTSSSWLTILPIFLPFLGLLILYVFGLFSDWKKNNIPYNFVETLAFLTIVILVFRTIFDKNIIPYPYQINLGFYNVYEGKIKILLYLMIIGNILLLYYQKKKIDKIHS